MDDDDVDDIKVLMSEREAAADGRPDVYTPPLDLNSLQRKHMSTGRRRLLYGSKDRLLLALRRHHGRSRYDFAPELINGR